MFNLHLHVFECDLIVCNRLARSIACCWSLVGGIFGMPKGCRSLANITKSLIIIGDKSSLAIGQSLIFQTVKKDIKLVSNLIGQLTSKLDGC